jgi:hypothetical protein
VAHWIAVIRRARRLPILACIAVALLCPAGASAARSLELGISDGIFTQPAGAAWLQRSAAVGAKWVRIDIGWVAPDTATRPAGFNARNPNDPNYNFTSADAVIREASQVGERVLVTFTGAPPWAEAPGRPSSDPAGSWRPDPRALQDYAIALGLRYSGHFPDPANPWETLPRVSAFQVWNEPNLDAYLNPQWSGGKPASPVIYRSMLNAFYRGIKSVDPSALVVTAGTAPFGDPQPGGQRIQPALFWRIALCLNATHNGGLVDAGCRDPAHFDVLAHHPYSWGSPTEHALWPNDVAVPDLGKLTRLLRAAERDGMALPHIHHPLWVTEVSYNSSPPLQGGLPLGTQANWLEQTLAELWREGTSVVMWYEIVDAPPDPPYGGTDSGLFFESGRPKPALTAFSFPLTAWRVGRSGVEVWGRAPAGGRLVLQMLVGSTWKPVRSMREGAGATFVTQITATGPVSLRAQVGGQTSLVWHLA